MAGFSILIPFFFKTSCVTTWEKKRVFSKVALILSACFVLSACSFFHKDPVVLQINEKKWKMSAFAKRLAQKVNSFNIDDVSNPAFLDSLKKQLMGDLLIEYLVQKRAREYALQVSEQEWQEALNKIQNSYSRAEVFDLYLKRQKINKKAWEESLKRTLLHKKVVRHIGRSAQKPSDKEIKEYYQNHPSLFKEKAQLFIYHVFYKQKEKALQVREALKKGQALPKEPAQTGGPQAGGPLTEEKQWVERGTFALFDRAFSLKKNQISPVWASPDGYHVIQVLDKKSARLIPYQSAKPRVQKLLMDQRQRALWTEWLNTESQRTKVWTDKIALKKIFLNPTGFVQSATFEVFPFYRGR